MTGRRGLRLFVAADPPPEVSAALSHWARGARHQGVRPLAPANIHLTLAFLGSRPGADVDPILAALADAVHEFTLGGPRGAIALETSAPVGLPPRRPRALAVEVADPSGALGELRQAVAAALGDRIGWEDDRPRFRPHLTAGRLSAPPDRVAALAPAPAQQFTVDTVTLYRSFLEPEGARYEPLGSVALV